MTHDAKGTINTTSANNLVNNVKKFGDPVIKHSMKNFELCKNVCVKIKHSSLKLYRDGLGLVFIGN